APTSRRRCSAACWFRQMMSRRIMLPWALWLPVVFLEVPLADAVKRVGLDAPRPLLAVNPRARWRELMEARRPLYLEVATAVVDTAGRTPGQVADAVLEALELKTPHD
ncbi:shikimate kinase, partial [Kitasatospora sp. NPDC001574]